jgi:KDO2-lipid IV(A) lauroyltransferase
MRLVGVGDLYLGCALALTHAVGWSRSTTAKEWAAAGAGSVAYALSVRKRRRSEAALGRAMGPALAARERRAIVRGSFRQFWREAFSLVISERERRALGAARVEGLEHLRSAIRHGAGVILWESSYFGARLKSKRILRHHGFAVHQVHADNHIAGFRNSPGDISLVRRRVLMRLFERHESRAVSGIVRIPQGSDSLAFTRDISRLLRQGATVCTSSDGPVGQRFVVLPFLGHAQPFATGIVSLARTQGAAILPIFCFDDPPGQSRLVIEPAIPVEPDRGRDTAVEEALARYRSLLESYVRRYPAQYRSWPTLGGPDDT